MKKHTFLGLNLKRNTWKTIILLVGIAVFLITLVNIAFAQGDQSTDRVEQKLFPVKVTPTPFVYQEPDLASLPQQEKAIAIIKKTWRRDWQVGVVLARCESGFREDVVNEIKATGYFQILAPVHKVPVSDMQNGYANASFAYVLYMEQGLNPWEASRACWEGEI